MKLVAAGVVVLFAVLLSVKLLSGGKPHLDPNGRGTSDAAVLLSEAKTLMRKGQWAAAKVKLEEVRAEDEDYSTKQIENYLKVAEEEIPNEERFAAASDAMSKGELARAQAALAQVKTSTQQRTLDEAKTALTQRIESRRGEARSLLGAAKWPELLALSDDLLVVVPADREASLWKDQAEQALAKGKRGPVKVVSTEAPWVDAQQLFKNGDLTGARSLAQACSKKFAKCRDFENGLSVLEAKTAQLESLSDGDLLTMFKLDRELAGGVSSGTSKPLRARVAQRYFLKASGAKSTGSWVKAIEYARDALDAEPGHAGAQALISEAKAGASDLYYRAYQQRESDPPEAVKLFKEVVAMTPADDEQHKKAQGFIDRLEPH